ncbi:hypothetical protein MFLAVUS_002603 [Mucor flavus]|uniref:[histone H3]-lysine(36) N-trimethyltransferase n=1 Tax=Mucor flavus TaxID=439312 RepID=A0ABP9YQQ3_9FUNG
MTAGTNEIVISRQENFRTGIPSMQSADIRLVPSRTLSIGFDDKLSNCNQENNYDGHASSLMDSSNDLNTFHDLSVQSEMDITTTTSPLDEHYLLDEEEMEANNVSEKEESEEPQLPSATADAMETYTNINENIYCGSATGKSIAEESMPCECKYRPDIDNPDAACGDDNYCINRMMFMECMVDDCPCERYCRNRRFQLRQYARVDVIRTDKKGFGLRALTDLPTNAFIMEYIGEVIPNHEFIRRTKEYEAAGLEHYYFMTLKTDEIIDATKKGCLARFINHSCNPNSVTQKWVVGKNMRIGIFTRRPIKAGQELTFDYKFERYGAVAQRCYCGEANCKGFIGGSLKSDAPKATEAIIDDDQIDDDDDDDDDDEDDSDQDDSDTAEAVTLTQKKMLRKMHRRRASEPLQDTREVQSFVKRMLDSVGKSHLVLKLLLRLELTDKNSTQGREVLKKFVRLHGLKMLKFWLSEWKNDAEILIKVLHVLSQLPLANKNGLEDCKMFEIVGRLTNHENEEICDLANELLQDWDKLKSVYRIPKRIPIEPSRKVDRDQQYESDNKDKLSEVSEDIVIPPRYDSSREFFDPDDDYFEYLSLDADAAEIQWKTEYPPRSTIPTAPRAMIDACIKNGYYGFGRPSRVSTPSHLTTYPATPNDVNSNNPTTTTSDPYNSDQDTYDRSHASYGSPYKSSDYKNSKLNEYYNTYNIPSSNTLNSTSYFDSPHATAGSPAASVSVPAPKLPNNWKSAYAEDGTIYYYHRITGKTQWNFPEERVSSIEGVNQSDLEDLVEKTIQDAEKKRLESARSESPAVSVASRNGVSKSSPRIITPSVSRRGSGDVGVVHNSLDETELKKEVGKIVTKYLSSKQKSLWKGDKYLFKELARKITHHIVDRETQSSRKIHAINSSVRSKIEKFIDSHGSDLVLKINRKRKHHSISTATPTTKEKTDSPSSVISEEISSKYSKTITSSFVQQQQSLLSTPDSQALPASGGGEDNLWDYSQDIPTSPAIKTEEEFSDKPLHNITYTAPPPPQEEPVPEKPAHLPSPTKDESYYYNSRRSRADSPYSRDKLYGESSRYASPSAGEYVRPGYSRPHYNAYSSPSYYRYPPPPSSGPYYRSSNPRYYSGARGRPSPPPYYHRPSASSSRRGSLSDDEMDRRRWD